MLILSLIYCPMGNQNVPRATVLVVQVTGCPSDIYQSLRFLIINNDILSQVLRAVKNIEKIEYISFLFTTIYQIITFLCWLSGRHTKKPPTFSKRARPTDTAAKMKSKSRLDECCHQIDRLIVKALITPFMFWFRNFFTVVRWKSE